MDLLVNNTFHEINNDGLHEVNGGGVAGFLAGYMLGTVVGYAGVAVMAAAGATQEEGAQVLLSSIAFFSTAGAVCSGPV